MFSPFGFSIQEVSYAIFIVKKRPLYVNFSIMCKMTFFSRFHKSCGYEILLTCT
jgi:hypothetical protein